MCTLRSNAVGPNGRGQSRTQDQGAALLQSHVCRSGAPEATAHCCRAESGEAARIVRQKRKPYHVEYCRKPEYRAKKHAYDVRRYHEKSFGPLADVSLLLRDLIANINERTTDYENRR